MRRKSILFTLTALLTIWPLAGIAQNQEETPPHQHGTTSGQEKPAEMPMEGHPMMARHQAMQERMQAMDAELDRLLEEARAASGDAKVEALTDVVEKLVEQRKAMHQMMEHHQSMTTKMMHHQMMQKMHGADGRCSMPDCPMGKDMHGAPDEAPEAEEGSQPDEDHEAHHPE